MSPDLALNAAVLELGHLAELSLRLCRYAIQNKNVSKREFTETHDAVVKLVSAVGEFIMGLQRTEMSLETAASLPKILRTNQYYLAAAELAVEIRNRFAGLGDLDDSEMAARQQEFRGEIIELLAAADMSRRDFSITELEEKLALLQSRYDLLKETNLQRGVTVVMPVAQLSELLEQNSDIRRMTVQIGKGSNYLFALSGSVNKQFQDKAQQQELRSEIV